MADTSLSGINVTLKTSDDKEITLPKEVRRFEKRAGSPETLPQLLAAFFLYIGT
jgi:hypothetical protein